MRYYFLFFTSLLIVNNSLGQDDSYTRERASPTPFFNAYNFKEGGYQLILLSTRLGNVDSAHCYYSNDPYYIQYVQSNLTGTRSPIVYPFRCSENQVLHLCKANQIIETVSFSVNCRAAYTPNGNFHYLGYAPLHMPKLRLQKHLFKKAKKGRKYMDSIQQDSNLVFITPEPWMEYEGKFGFFYENKSYDSHLVEQVLIKKLKKQFPNETFELKANSSSSSSKQLHNYHVRVCCSKRLFDQFVLRSIDGNKWQPFPITFTSYWK